MFTKQQLDTIAIKNYGQVPMTIEIGKHLFKYVINTSIKLIDLHKLIKSRLELNAYESLVFFCLGRIIGLNGTVGMLYSLYKNKQGVLEIIAHSESVFG